MDKIIFLMFEEFVSINSELMANTGFCLYFWQKIEKKFARLDNLNLKDFNESDFSFCDWFFGERKDEGVIALHTKETFRREQRKGFVTVSYEGEDEYAIGATRYSADSSSVEKIVNRELNKLFKKYARKGVIASDGTTYKILDNYYLTEKAVSSGKNWRLFIGRGVRKESNKTPGFIPKP